jgi:hypothetical protein
MRDRGPVDWTETTPNSRIKSVALEAFDAAALTNAEPDAIATVWLHNAVDFGEL